MALSTQAHAAISFFGAASTANSDAAARAVTPPGSMLTNDYVLLLAAAEGAIGDVTISNAGGQTWTSETALVTTPTGGSNPTLQIKTRLFHTRFNGTWSADPSVIVASPAGEALTLVMLVFRGVDTTTAIDVSPVSASYNATTQVTISEITTNTNGAMAVAFWTSRDDNTWSLVTSGWDQAHTQVANGAGSDNSISHAYKIQATAGGTGSVRNDQATLGGDAGHTWILALKEQAAAANHSRRVIIAQ